MGVTVTQQHQLVGDWEVDVTRTPAIHAEVWDSENKRPRKVHVLIYDQNDDLVYVGVLLRVTGDKVLKIGGSGLLWHLGQGEIGPLIADREYVSGTNKLSNGNFAFGDLLWQLPSEESNWVINVGSVFNSGGLNGDDVLNSDEKFPTSPGKSYRATSVIVHGAGTVRTRIIFEGEYNPSNLWVNGDLTAGVSGWSGGTVATILHDPPNATPGHNNVMRCLPIPKPVLTADPGFETGTGWTSIVEPAPMSPDITLVNDPANAASGAWVMKVGPVTQHQVFTNADYGLGGSFWYASSSDAEPHAVFGTWPGDGVNGSDGIITTGYATAGRPGPEKIKYLRADSINGGGVDTYTVRPGEEYRAECYFAGAPGTEGFVYISIMFPKAGSDLWYHSDSYYAPPHDDWRWFRASIENIVVPEDQTTVNGLIEVHDHGLGHWKMDSFVLVRTAGNRAKSVSDATYSVDVDTTYEVAGLLRAGENLQSGFVRLGAVLSGAGLEDQTEGDDRGSTDNVWDRVVTTVRPTTGYTTLGLSVMAQDIVGDPAYIDNITVTKMDNNRDGLTGSIINVTPERTYRAKCKFKSSLGYAKGDGRMVFRCIRAGSEDVIMEASPVGDTLNEDGTATEWVESSYDVTPPSGYSQVEPKVVFLDIEGAPMYAADFTFTDTDTTTVVFDTVMSNPGGASPYVDATAPEGTREIRTATIVEQGSSSWVMFGMSLARTGVTPATVPAIVADLLKDPDTGEPLSLVAGSIASGTIPYDWQIYNLTNRDALEHLVAVVADPALEFKVGNDRALHVGQAVDIFTDHNADSLTPIVLLAHDMDVKELSNAESNVEERATVIHVFGADRETVSGKKFKIEAESTVPGTPEKDWNQRVIRRVKPIHDGTVDHQGYAQALADDIAAKEAMPALSLTATISGLSTRPNFDVGDWLYAYKPEAGLEDTTNPMSIEGDTVFPRKVRVLARTRELGPTHRIELRRGDGTIFDFPQLSVQWAKADSTSLTLGDRVLDWENDPQGGLAAMRYLRDRQSGR